MKRFAIIACLLIVALSGCIEIEEKLTPRDHCIMHCQVSLQHGEDLSSGPCLSDENLNWEIDDWVCDVAHNPRIEIDNDPENQCEEYGEGTASHFVEVDTNCNFIREQ